MPATYEALSQGGHEAMATEIFTKIKAYLDTHGADSKVAKAGDTMTGPLVFNSVNNAIQYHGTQATYPMIKFIDNTGDVYGNGISIGGGGTTIIGGGESSDAMASSLSGGGNELMYIGNDGNVNIFTNLQNGWDSRKTFTFDTNGALTATKFIGPLQGTADNATKWKGCSYDLSTLNTTDTWIPVLSSSKMQHTLRAIWSAKTHSNYNTNQHYLVTLSCLTYWDGAYNSSHNSNLTYCNRGAFGTIVTKNTGDYIATTGGNITGTNRFKLNNNQEIYQNEGYLILGTSNMVCVRTYNNINAARPIQAASFQTYSSRLIKKNITDITQDEAKSLLNLRVVDFDYIEQVGGQTNQTGIIAEEALTVYPKCVDIPENYNEDEVKKAIETGGAINAINVDYTKLIAPLIKLVQMQQKKIEDLEAAIKAL